MRVVIAPDAFKESLAASDVAAAIEAGFRAVFPDWTYIRVPIADGGEGTVEAMVAATGGRIVRQTVTGPLGQPVDAFFGLIEGNAVAVIEMAAASGLMHLRPDQRDPMLTTSFGVGELIRTALDEGARHFIIGIGGSATNDGGAGMIQALGVRLLNRGGREIGWGGAALADLATIDVAGIDPRLASCDIEVACDVDNPLVGPAGASAIFGPQKGATPAMAERLDQNLQHYAACIEAALRRDIAYLPGGGAAGGLGAALAAFMGARLRSGVDIVNRAIGLDALIADADLVITGEGRIDGQTVRGKTPIGVARVAARHGKPVIGLAGALGQGFELLHRHGIDAVFSSVSRCCTLEDALREAAENVRVAARNVAAAVKIGQHLADARSVADNIENVVAR